MGTEKLKRASAEWGTRVATTINQDKLVKFVKLRGWSGVSGLGFFFWDIEPEDFALGCLGLPGLGRGREFAVVPSVWPLSAVLLFEALRLRGFLIDRPAALRRWPTANGGSGGVLFEISKRDLIGSTRTMRSDLILPFIVGLGLCATGVHGLVLGRGGNPIVPVIWICLGAVSLWLFVAGVRRLGETVIARGRMQLDGSLRASSVVEIGPDVVGTRVVLRFADAVLRFKGLAEFEIVQDGVLVWQGSRKLRSMRPRQYRVPQWMPTSDAGSVYVDISSRKLRFRAVAMDLPGKLASKCSVGVRVELASNFKGFELDKWHPIAECEAIDVEIYGNKQDG